MSDLDAEFILNEDGFRRFLADPEQHASPGCACGVNAAGDWFVDPICGRLEMLDGREPDTSLGSSDE